MTLLSFALQDWAANRRNPKGRLVLLMFRVAQICRRAPGKSWLIFIPYLVFYRIAVEWLLGIEIPWGVTIGPRIRLYHGVGLVIHDKTRIGADVILRHNTTIGLRQTAPYGCTDAPCIGDNVDIGAHAAILGPISVGNNAKVGSGAVVIHDVAPNTVVVGNPARAIRPERDV